MLSRLLFSPTLFLSVHRDACNDVSATSSGLLDILPRNSIGLCVLNPTVPAAVGQPSARASPPPARSQARSYLVGGSGSGMTDIEGSLNADYSDYSSYCFRQYY